MKKLAITFLVSQCLCTKDMNVNINLKGNTSTHNSVIQLISIKPLYDEVSKNLTAQWQKTNAKKIALYAAGATYVGFLTHSLYARYKIYNSKGWCNLFEEIPFSKLVTIPEKKLYESIKKAIEMRYNTPGAHIMMNIPQFLKESSSERKTIQSYINLGSILQLAYLHPLLLITRSSIDDAKEKIKRLNYLCTVISNHLEPDNVVNRLNLVNAFRRCPTSTQHASSHRR